MSREDFEIVVGDALDRVPEHVLDELVNVVFVVEEDAPEHDPHLLGLYDGIPITERGTFVGVGALPDKITVFRNPTLAICETAQDVIDEVHITVVHEIAHYFGIDDERLHELGWE